MFHLFDLCSIWSKAEGNGACRIIYGQFGEKYGLFNDTLNLT